MVEYKCDICNKKFKQKSHYMTHINKKFSCAPKNTNLTPAIFSVKSADVNKYHCEFCSISFTRNSNLKRHVDNRCKKKKKNDNEHLLKQLLNEMQELKNKMSFLEKENEKLKSNKKKKIINNINENSNNINNVQINNNFNIVAFGKEELENIVSDNVCKKILNKGFQSVIHLIEYVHFDKNKPEYHNCYISNMRDKYSLIYDGNQWKLSETEDIINTLKEDKKLFLENKFEEFYDKLDEKTKTKFNNFLSEAETDKVLNKLKNDIKLLLYNKRGIILETKKKLNDNETILQIKN